MATAIRIDGKAKAAELSEKIAEETAALARCETAGEGERGTEWRRRRGSQMAHFRIPPVGAGGAG